MTQRRMDGVEFNIINYMYFNGSQVKEDRDQTIGISPCSLHTSLFCLSVHRNSIQSTYFVGSVNPVAIHNSISIPHKSNSTHSSRPSHTTPPPLAVVYPPTLQFSIGGGSSPAARPARVLLALLVAMETYTTDDALTAMGFGKFQVLVLVYAGTGWLADSMELMLLSFVGPLIRQQWNVSAQHESLLSSVVFTGMLIGACSWGYISDKYGRRTALLFSIILTTGAGFLSALSPNYISLLVFRFLVGIGVGGTHVFSSWFLEFVPAKNRGTWMIVFSVFWTIGTILEASLAWVVLTRLSWRWLLAFTALPCLLLLLLFVIAPESPRYLCVQNRISDATLVLERMAKANKVALPPGVLTYQKETQLGDHDRPLTSQNGHLPVRENDRTVDNAMSSKSGGIAALRKLFSRKLLRSTLLIWFVWFANAFAYYGLVLLSSQLADANRRCTSGQKSELHQKNVNLYKDVFITSLAEFPGLVISAIIVDWFGRKATMWILLFGCCAFLGPLAVHQKESLTTALLFGARACGMGSSTVLCLYAPEVYPTSARSTGVGIATAIGKIGGIVCPIIAVGMLRSCHQMEAVVVFELVLGLAGLACILFPVETKGREMK